MTELNQQQKFERIKQLAKKRKMTLTEINDKSGLGTNSIYHWRNKKPSTDSLSKVAKTLNVSVDYLLGNTDDPTIDKKSSNVTNLDDDDAILAFNGRPISDEYKKMIIAMLNSVEKQEGNK